MMRIILVSAVSFLMCSIVPALADEKGIFRITTDPGEAMIFIDGKRKGTSSSIVGRSLAVRLPEGEYKIEALIPIDQENEKYGKKEGVFLGSDTIQPVHIKIHERLTILGKQRLAEANRIAEEQRIEQERIAEEQRIEQKRIAEEKRLGSVDNYRSAMIVAAIFHVAS